MFTMELKIDRSLLFLDCHLHRKEDGRIIVTVTENPHKSRYCDKLFHPIHGRSGVVRSLYDRKVVMETEGKGFH